MNTSRPTIAGAVRRILTEVGENPERDGLKDTPMRVAKALQEFTSGYTIDPAKLLTTFEETEYDEMVIVKDIPIYSKCEHHLETFFGTVTIGYIPQGRVVGLSKLSRLADVYAKRLQVQERLTHQIADALFTSEIKPRGVGVLVSCRHMCMEARGICKQGHHTITSALRGVIKEGMPRAEFLKLAGEK